jgi:two-component system nitrogen regulation sensor histidine kinase NtrY
MPLRRARWGVRILVLLAGAWGLYYLWSRYVEAGRSLDTTQVVLPALSLALVVLTLGLAGVLIRDLVKLILERRRGVLGARLRTKLVFFFLAFVLLPAIVLFSGSAQVIKRTVEAILQTPLEQLKGGTDVVDQWNDHFLEHGERRAAALAEELRREGLADAARGAELAALLQVRVAQEGLQLVRVRAGDRLLAAAHGALPPAELEQLALQLDRLIAEAAREPRPVRRTRPVGTGLAALAALPVDGTAGPETVVVGVAQLLPQEIAANVEAMHAAAESYRQFRTKRRELVRFYVTLIGLVFLATLFVATWIGLHVARRITEPIEEVAAATREIAAGNLNVRVRVRVGDEMATLVEAFNEMAGELMENREVITRSTAELRRSNRALDERRRYIEALVANLSTAVLSLDAAGRVTTSNPAVQKVLGLALAPGDDARQVLQERRLQPLADLLERTAGLEGEGTRASLELVGPAGPQHVSVQITPLQGAADESPDRLIMMEDLSELLRAQKALAWREVARRIAHEIKNPLTPIQLAAQRLRKKFFSKAEDLDRVLLESTASIEHEVTALKQLVDEFSRFARMPEIEPRPVELDAVVESVLSLYRGLPGIEWQVELDPGVGRIHADPLQLRRALINLIDNAVAAVDGQGTVRVGARPVRGTGTVRIEVADSGPGIPPGDRDKLFAPYFSTKRRGTGLGLAIVHRVITDHRGTIRVEDNEPHGARFVIDIPAAP